MSELHKLSSRIDIAIVGGGLAGVAAARLLQQRGIDFVLFEARERLGGRIMSLDQDGEHAHDGFDLGPSWFWPDMQTDLATLIRDLDLEIFPQYVDGDLMVEHSHSEPPMRYSGFRQEPSMRIVGGTAALVRALVQSIPDDRLRINTLISRVHVDDDVFTLVADDGTVAAFLR